MVRPGHDNGGERTAGVKRAGPGRAASALNRKPERALRSPGPDLTGRHVTGMKCQTALVLHISGEKAQGLLHAVDRDAPCLLTSTEMRGAESLSAVGTAR